MQYFINKRTCSILIQNSADVSDTEELKNIFSNEYIEYNIEFNDVFTLSKEMIQLLFQEIVRKSKKVFIHTSTRQLHTYLTKVGIQNTFDSVLKKKILFASKIKIILLGGSADSSSKILYFVQNCTLENVSLVIVQHVEPQKVGMFDTILQEYTKSKVSYATDGELIQKGAIYIAPNNKHLLVKHNRFVLSDAPTHNFSKPSISLSYQSFCQEYKEALLVIQECGYGADGVDQLAQLIKSGSKVIIQNPKECKAEPMVVNAQKTNMYHYLFSKQEILAYMSFLDKEYTPDEWLEYLLNKIFEYHNYDFKLYNKDMIKRRVEVLMIHHEIKHIKDDVGMILFSPSVFHLFLLEVSINVTEFFREPSSFKEMVRIMNESHTHKHNIKIWSAGCSNGKEPYSVAILFASLGLLDKLLIYATDFNDVMIENAKNGIYPYQDIEQATLNFETLGLNDHLQSYIQTNEYFFSIHENIRKKILFFQHNLLLDSSFNEFDTIICKNVLIYFKADLQIKVFNLFYDSLKFGGILVLGESEALHSSIVEKFQRVSQICNIYRKVK